MYIRGVNGNGFGKLEFGIDDISNELKGIILKRWLFSFEILIFSLSNHAEN